MTAAARELKEETGLIARDLTSGPTKLVAPRHLETVVFGRAESSQAPILSREIFEARWITPGALDADLTDELLQGHVDILAGLDSHP